MARPRDEELDEKIIQSAADEFHQNGYGPMTLASVAKRAGVRPGGESQTTHMTIWFSQSERYTIQYPPFTLSPFRHLRSWTQMKLMKFVI